MCVFHFSLIIYQIIATNKLNQAILESTTYEFTPMESSDDIPSRKKLKKSGNDSSESTIGKDIMNFKTKLVGKLFNFDISKKGERLLTKPMDDTIANSNNNSNESAMKIVRHTEAVPQGNRKFSADGMVGGRQGAVDDNYRGELHQNTREKGRHSVRRLQRRSSLDEASLNTAPLMKIVRKADKSKVVDINSILTKVLMTYLQVIMVIVTVDQTLGAKFKFLHEFYGNPFGPIVDTIHCFIPIFKTQNVIHLRMVALVLIPMLEIFLIYLFFKASSATRSTAKTITSILVIYFNYFPDLVSFFFSAFPCRKVSDSLNVMKYSTEISCDTNSYQLFQVIVGLFLIFFLVIVPLVIWLNLSGSRDNLEAIRPRFGLFINDYDPRLYWWEFLKLLQKAILMLGIYLFENDFKSKAMLLILVLVIYYFLTRGFKPYYDEGLNKIDTRSTKLYIITLFLVLFYTENKIQGLKDISLIILALLNLKFIVQIIYKMVSSQWQKIRQLLARCCPSIFAKKDKKKKEKALEMNKT